MQQDLELVGQVLDRAFVQPRPPILEQGLTHSIDARGGGGDVIGDIDARAGLSKESDHWNTVRPDRFV